MRRAAAAFLLLGCVALLLPACGSVALPKGPLLATLDGGRCRPLDAHDNAIHVLVFVTHDCPIANAYAPTLAELAPELAAHGVRLFLLHVDPDLTVAEARAHQQAYGLPDPIALDSAQEAARLCSATVTPEAVVIQGGFVRYQGRIDDAWAGLGDRRAVGRRDLWEAVREVLAGRPVSVPRTEAVGCLLPSLSAGG